MRPIATARDVVSAILLCTGFLPLASTRCTSAGSPFYLFDLHGTVSSPGYPDYYNGNEFCDWHLSPPRGTWPELLVLDLLALDTNVDGLPDSHDVCIAAKNYLDVGNARACGQEPPICVTFILSSSRDFDCHKTIGKYFSHCRTVLHNIWPFKVSFRTDQPDNKAGFSLNYTFVECGVDRDPTTAAPPPSQTTKQGIDETGNSTTIAQTRATTSGTGIPITISTKTTNIDETVAVVTSPTLTTTPRTRVTTTTGSRVVVTTTAMKTKGTAEPKPQSSNLVLTVLLVILCVLFLIILVTVIFRKRIRAWLTEKKRPAYTNGDVPAQPAYEQPLPTVPPPVPPPYYSTSLRNGNGIHTGDTDSNGYDKLNGTTNGHANGGHATLNNGIVETDSTYSTIEV